MKNTKEIKIIFLIILFFVFTVGLVLSVAQKKIKYDSVPSIVAPKIENKILEEPVVVPVEPGHDKG